MVRLRDVAANPSSESESREREEKETIIAITSSRVSFPFRLVIEPNVTSLSPRHPRGYLQRHPW